MIHTFFRELGWALAIVETTRFFTEYATLHRLLTNSLLQKYSVAIQWYKELFKRVESTQEYMIEINNKSIYKVKLNLYNLGKIFILANER